MIDLSSVGVVDNHCHGFLPSKETRKFEQYFSMSTVEMPSTNTVNMFVFRRAIRELSRLLDRRGSWQEIVSARNVAYRRDPKGYFALLFADANIEMLLVDTGYPASDILGGYTLDLDEFRALVPCPVKEISRIDNMLVRTLRDRLSFEDAASRVSEHIDRAVRRDGAVALKSIVAYFTGLEVRREPLDEVRPAFDSLVSRVRDGEAPLDLLFGGSKAAKTVMDHFVILAAQKSVQLDVPFQVHTGMGGAPMLDLRKTNPAQLRDLIGDPELADARFVLLHGGYPFVEEAGFFASTYPNVYVDLSEMVPYVSLGVERKIGGLLEMSPTSKILYGSDADAIPEVFWLAALETRRSLSSLLGRLVESDAIDEEWAIDAAKQILRETSTTLYHLDI